MAAKKIRGVDPNVVMALQEFSGALDEYKGDLHNFWALHGANFLASDYVNGLWTPLFEGIYGDHAVIPDLESAFDLVMARYWSGGLEWKGDGQAIAAWMVQKPEGMILYYLSALRQVGEAYPDVDPEIDLRRPYNVAVWRMFHQIKMQTLSGAAMSPPEETPHVDVDAPGPSEGPDVQPDAVADPVAGEHIAEALG